MTRERGEGLLAAVTLLVTDPLYLEHSAPGHVECPERLTAILDHFRKRGLLKRLTPLAPRDATVDEIALMHGRAYIEVVREVSERGGGWFDSDTYLNEHSYAAAVHERQALVLVNRGGATGADILELAQAIQRDVLARFGVELEQEPVSL